MNKSRVNLNFPLQIRVVLANAVRVAVRKFRPRGDFPPVCVPDAEVLAGLGPGELAAVLRGCSVPFAGADWLFGLVLGRLAARDSIRDGLVALSNMVEALGDPGTVLDEAGVRTLGELISVYPFLVVRLYVRLADAAPDLPPALLAEMNAQILRFYADADLRHLLTKYKLSRALGTTLLDYADRFVARALPRAGCADPDALRDACAKHSHAALAKTLRKCVAADPDLWEIVLGGEASEAGV